MSGLPITSVEADSPAAECGIEAGDLLLAVNGHPLRDLIDFRFHTAEEELFLELLKPSGEVWEIELERDLDEPLGMEVAPPEPARCGNRCIFCFVHQLPSGLRPPLYVKDEDYRLSFLYGNYVTLANVSAADLARIREQRLSPLYVSVHAVDPPVRERLLGRREERPVLEILKELAEAGIRFHTQVVLCPGINDGEVLERTVRELAALRPAVRSLAVVPVGLTRHRKGLPKLEAVTEEYAREILLRWEPEAARLARGSQGPFLFFSDEFYLKAGLPVPPAEGYGDFPQLENGVGMVRLFLDEAKEVLQEARPLPPLRALAVTGTSAAPFVGEFLSRLSEKTGCSITVLPVENRLFGKSVTVAGLVAGADIGASLRGAPPADLVLIPDVLLKEGEGLFLDDMTPQDLQRESGRPVEIFCSSPRGVWSALQQAAGILEV